MSVRRRIGSAAGKGSWEMLKKAAVILVILVPVVLVLILFVPPIDPRVDCCEVDRNQISERWQSGSLLKRRSVVECVGGAKWDGSSSGVYASAEMYEDSGDFPESSSMLSGMNEMEVRAFLGPPSSDRPNYIRYNLGVKPSSPAGRLLDIGWPLATRSFCVHFDEETGLVSAIYIGGS